MARIAGVNIPTNKRVLIALQYIHGIGQKNAADILEKVNNGTGTLGALVNDPGLYEDARALVGGANRNRIVRNLVRKTAKDGEAAKNEARHKSDE